MCLVLLLLIREEDLLLLNESTDSPLLFQDFSESSYQIKYALNFLLLWTPSLIMSHFDCFGITLTNIIEKFRLGATQINRIDMGIATD